MNKSELVEEIVGRTRLPAVDVATVVDAFIVIVTRSVTRGEKVVLSGFGTFHRKARARRTALISVRFTACCHCSSARAN